MWNKPYTLKEGTAIVAGLLVTGGLLQVTLGPLEWGLFAWPANFITLIPSLTGKIIFHKFSGYFV